MPEEKKNNAAVAAPQPVVLLTDEQKEAALAKIDAVIEPIQKQINALRVDGTDKVTAINDEIKTLKKNKDIDPETRDKLIQKDQILLSTAKQVQQKNEPEITKLIQQGEAYLKEHFDKDCYAPLKSDIAKRQEIVKAEHQKNNERLTAEHQKTIAKLQSEIKPDAKPEVKTQQEQLIKNENFVFKNRLFDEKMSYQKKMQALKDEKHEAFVHEYHLIDLLRNSKFTIDQTVRQKIEHSIYTFNARDWLLKYVLYIVIIVVFIALCIYGSAADLGNILTWNNIFEILSQSVPKIYWALGVAGLILIAGTDLSLGRMIALGGCACAILWHKGTNSLSVFDHYYNFDSWTSLGGKIIVAFLLSVVLCVIFSALSGFFTAKFKIHPFITTMSTALIIYGFVNYATSSRSSGTIDSAIQDLIVPYLGRNEDTGFRGFPTIIFWGIAAIAVIWFIWNKTKFGKNMYAVGGNAEAASVSGISVFWTTFLIFIMAGVMYGLGAGLEVARIGGNANSSLGNSWEMDAIAACVVGGISFNGGIGKISGAVAGAIIFQALLVAFAVLGINVNLQYVFKGIIILAAVTLDSVKYLKKK
jgi:methyl-galactoside transport system permease protein